MLPDTMIIDLPEHQINDYIEVFLSWLKLPDNETLLYKIRQVLKAPFGRNQPMRVSDIDLITSPLFASLDEKTQ